MSLISYQAENNIKESFVNCHSYVLHIVMENYKEEEEKIERLVRRLVDSVNEDVIMDDDQRQESVNDNLMDVDTGQQDTLSPSLGNMCGVSTADTSLTGEITQGSEQPMEWHCHVNDPPHVNCSEGIEGMEWQEGGGPHENVSVLGPQNVNYGHRDIEMEEEEEEPQLADDDLTIDVFNFPQTFFI